MYGVYINEYPNFTALLQEKNKICFFQKEKKILTDFKERVKLCDNWSQF